MSFAQWVKDTRERQNLTIVECATRAGVSHPTWIEYENLTKNKQPRRDTVIKIAEALRVSDNDALQAAGYHVTVEVPAELATIWRQVPTDRRASFLRAIRSVAEAVSV